MTIDIRDRATGTVLYTAEAEDMRSALVAAVGSGANLSGANLSRANLFGANLSRANLSVADLSRANLFGANLSGANLFGADLSRANLSVADLSRANLSRADLSRANLSGANLSVADLFGANLFGADLFGADLSRANLSRAEGISVERSTPLYILRDQPGTIRAYKLVTAQGVGPYNGGITYHVGQCYNVPDANTDERDECAAGINLATLDWCLREWREGYRVLMAEFTAADIAAIPVGSDGKFRVFRCRIVGEKDVSALVQRPEAQ